MAAVGKPRDWSRETIPLAKIRWTGACRLIPSRDPTAGLFDRVASAADLEALFELEGWTNDRLSNEFGVLATIPRDARMEMRLYRADIRATFHDVCSRRAAFVPLYDPGNYEPSQQLGDYLRHAGSNGAVHRSVRHPTGECIACFRPAMVGRLRPAGHYEYRWEGSLIPRVRKM